MRDKPQRIRFFLGMMVIPPMQIVGFLWWYVPNHPDRDGPFQNGAAIMFATIAVAVFVVIISWVGLGTQNPPGSPPAPPHSPPDGPPKAR